MVYIPRFKKIQRRVSFPLNIPVLISVGIHLVFFSYLLPNLGGNNNGDKNSKLTETPVIELNSLESTRLPNTPLPQLSNFNLSSQPPLNNSNINIGTIPLPPINSLQLPSLNNTPVNLPNLPPPPSGYSNYGYNRLPRYAYNSLPRNNFNRFNNLKTSNIPYPSQLPPPPSNYTNTNFIFPPDIDGNFVDIVADDNSDNMRESLFPPSTNGEMNNPRDLINQNQNIPPNFPNKTQIAKKSSPRNMDGYANLVSKLQKDTKNTTNEEAMRNNAGWMSKNKIGNPSAIKTINIGGIYPKDACIRKLSGNAVYGVTVNPQGSVVNTQLIKSAGLPLFNQQALRQIQSRGFGANSQTQGYHVHVNFQPTNCPSLSMNGLGRFPSIQTNLQQKNYPNPPVTTNNRNRNRQNVTTPNLRKPVARKTYSNPPVTNNNGNRQNATTPNLRKPVARKTYSNPPVTTNNRNRNRQNVTTPNLKKPVARKTYSNPPVTTNNGNSQKVITPNLKKPVARKTYSNPRATINNNSKKVTTPNLQKPSTKKTPTPSASIINNNSKKVTTPNLQKPSTKKTLTPSPTTDKTSSP